MKPHAVDALPAAVASALVALGENLSVARLRRRESQRAWALRLGVSVPTLIRMERGDPGVGMGVYATALWLMGRTQALPELADPQADRGALERDVRAAVKRRAARSRVAGARSNSLESASTEAVVTKAIESDA
jgi:transcriptional regulator with XRE-family HTH domain